MSNVIPLPAGPRLERARGLVPELGIRSASGKKRRVLYGTMVPFNVWTEVDSVIEGHFMERFAPRSLDKTFAEGRDRMRCIFHHGKDRLGKLVLGSIVDLHADDDAAYYEVELFDSVEKESPLLLEGIIAGEYGTSMLFELVNGPPTMRPSRSTYNPNGIAERTVLEAKVLEFGPTPFAIYPSAVAAMRSLTDEVMIERLAADPDRFAALAERAGVAPLLDPMMSNAAAIKSVVDGGVDPDTVTSMVINDANSSTNVDVPQTTTTITMPPAIRAVDDDPVTARRYARAAEYIGTTVWALTPTALATVLTIIGERVMGHRPSNEEILERIGGRPRADVADEPPTPDSPVRVIDIAGPIVPHAGMMDNTSSSMRSVEGIQSDLRAAVADETVKQIMLHIDSPGGSAELIPEIAAEIRDARKSKPITAMANTMAGSGAYWIASAADEIVVTPSGSVGSIGVYGAHEDISALQEREGVRTTLVSAGKFKVEGNPFEPLTEDARAEMQRRVDAIYKTFVKEVATGRGITAKKVEDDFGQGRMVMAVDAVERGMADRVATFTQTLARLEKAASSSATPTATRAAEHANAPEPHAATTPDATELHSDVPDLYGRKERPSWQL